MTVVIIIIIPLWGHALDNSSGKSSTSIQDQEIKSPWLAIPTVSSDPKLGTNLGAMAAYMHRFDPDSPVSMMGIMGKYSNTDSVVYSLFANTYFNHDQQRMLLFYAQGKIKNAYHYDLGEEGLDLRTNDDLNMAFVRFTQRVIDDWFTGLQYTNTAYMITGRDELSQGVIDALDLTGHSSNALGLVISFDNRDNQQSASTGNQFVLHNFAYREKLGGKDEFDAYMLEYSHYISHGEKNVLAFRTKGRWSNDAPNSGYSSMELRGYVRGQYLAEHSTFIELDERYTLKNNWGLTAFAGIGCLYGDNVIGNKQHCDSSDNLYPAIGAGISYLLKPKEKIVIRAEYAVGKDDNYGFYLKLGQPF